MLSILLIGAAVSDLKEMGEHKPQPEKSTMSNSKNLQTRMSQLLMTMVAFFSMSALATAQTTPGQHGQGDRSTQQPGTMQQQPGTNQQQGGQQGWQWFDDNATRDMSLNADSKKKLRDMDESYRKQYEAMGDTPWTHSNYQALTDRREADIKRTLTPDQHKQWTSRSGTRDGSSPSQDRGTMSPR